MGCYVRIEPIMKHLKQLGNTIGVYSFSVPKQILSDSDYINVEINVAKIDKYPLFQPIPYYKTLEYYYGIYGFGDDNKLNNDLSNYEKAIMSFQPDLIISNLDIYANIIAKKLHIPLISIIQGFFHPDLYKKKIFWWSKDEIKDGKLGNIILNNINKILSSYNVLPIDMIQKLFVGNCTLIPSFYEFDRVENNKIIYYKPTVEGANIHNCEMNFEYLFDENTIFVYLGRLQEYLTGDLAKQLLRSLQDVVDEYDYKLLVSASYNKGYLNFEHKKINIIESWIPADVIYNKSKLVVHHGGHSSCMSSLIYKKPSLIIPSNTERLYNAKAMEYLGCGLNVTLQECVQQPRLFFEYVNKMIKEYEFYLKNTRICNQKLNDEINFSEAITTAINTIF